MPPSSKRSQRVKREAPTSDDAPTTSPSRPSKRKRTTKETTPEPAPQLARPRNQQELDMTDQEIIDAVKQNLILPDHLVQVTIDHDDMMQQRQGVSVPAYALIAGRNWTYYVKRLSTSIGRPPEAYYPDGVAVNTPADSNEGTELPAAPTEPSRIHIDLGPNKVVSRLHAEIFFDSESECWNTIVNGRNGIKVDDRMVRRGQQAKLHSGQVIEIAGVEMMFLLPQNQATLTINKKYLRRAGLIDADDEAQEERTTEPKNPLPSSSAGLGGYASGQTPIAPAPPDYRRPDTPGKQKGKNLPLRSPYGPMGGMMMVNPDEVNLSLEENQHIKPSFTYSQLITQAFLSDPTESQTLAGIYKYCSDNYAWYRRAGSDPKGWQNSIRHNLSLNSGFSLRPRESHEPGKGGYWSFSAGKRDDLVADAWGGKARRSPQQHEPPRSSSPNGSPGKTGRRLHGPGDVNGGSPVQKLKRSSLSPLITSFPMRAPQSTPDRGGHLPLHAHLVGDGSPLPRSRRGVYGLSDNLQGSPPVLSSSFAPEEGSNLITPAPVRKVPFLAPPSTAQRPSQHMPTSSPAPFWRFADLSGTPIKPFDFSPMKDLAQDVAQSSSPPPAVASPSKKSSDVKNEHRVMDDGPDEEPAFDLSKGFIGIGRYHAVNNNALSVSEAANGRA